MGGLALVGLALAIGAIFGWVAFFRSLSQSEELKALRGEMENLKTRLHQSERQGLTGNETAAAKDTTSPLHNQPSNQKPDIESHAPPATGDTVDDDESALSSEPNDELEEIFTRPWKWARERAARNAAALDNSALRNNSETDARSVPASPREQNALEKSLTGNWLIWIGGAALALGGAFLLKSAIDAGFFGPVMRVVSAIAAGSAMIVAGEWARRTRRADELPNDEDNDSKSEAAWRHSAAPAVLAGAGGSTIYGAIFAAYGVFNLLPSLTAFVFLVAACGGMLMLAVAHRAAAVAALGLVGAYLSPLLTSSGDPAANALFIYVFGVSAAGLLVARIMSWRSIAYIALAGGFVWPLIWLVSAATPALVLYIYLPAYLALAGFVAWDEAEPPIDINALTTKGVAAFPVSMAAYHLASIAALTLAFLLSLQFGHADAAPGMWLAFCLITLAGANRREGFSVSPVIVVLALTLTIFVADRGETITLLPINAVFAALLGIGGYVAMLAQKEKGPVAAVAAFGPALILVAQYFHAAGLDQSTAWAFVFFALAAANIAMLIGLRRHTGNFNETPGAVSAFVMGATLTSSLAVAIGFEGLMMSAGLAIQAPVLAFLWLRYKLPTLKYGAAALATISSVRLLLLPEIVDYSFGGLPLMNMLIPGYLVPAAGFWFAARSFERGGLASTARIIQGLEAGAIALFTAFVSLQIRHLINDGDIGANRFSLLEVSLQTINWVSISAFLRWRFGDQLTRIRRVSELTLIGLAAVFSLLCALTFSNPWWGSDGPAIHGPPLFNLLLLFYLAPAIAFGAAAYVTRQSGAIVQARLAGLFGALLGFAWLVLTIRHFFHAPILSLGRTSLLEVSLQLIAWTMISTLLQYRFGSRAHLGVHIVERALLVLAAVVFLGFSLYSHNPWLHPFGPAVSGPPLFNMLLVYYLAPALAFGAASFAARRNGFAIQSRALGLGAAFIAFVWIIMSVRQFFHAPNLSGSDIGAGESWAYSIATIAYAVGLLIVGAFRRSAIMRYAGLGVLMLAILKVFVLDTAGLDGVWRASSFLGLGAALVGIAVLYQRLTLLEKAQRAKKE